MASAPKVRSLKSCNNPKCKDLAIMKDNLRQCARCQTATYCDEKCQRAHWTAHKDICKIWAKTTAETGEGVRDIKKKMNEFLWLIRGLPDYTNELFKRYISMIREGENGCVEFIFDNVEELDQAITLLQSLPILGEDIFRTCPYSPDYVEHPDGIPITLRRRTAKIRQEFIEVIDKKMCFLYKEEEKRPNLLNMINIAGSSERMLILVATMKLGVGATSSYEFLFKGLSWRPKDEPVKERLAIEGPDAKPRPVEIDMD